MASIQMRGKNSWLLVVEAGVGTDGKRIKHTKTVKADGKREAKKLLAEFQTEVEAGEYIAPQKMTFASFVDEWKEKYASTELGVKTLDIYTRMLKGRIIPAFGHMRIDQIQPFHIVKFLTDQSKQRKDGKKGNLSSGTVHYLHRVLNNIFSRATEWRILKNNPATDVKKPRVTHKEVEVYNEKEIQELFTALEKESLNWQLMILFALTTGLRRGEIVGLEWKHIDLKNGILEVKQNISSSINGVPVITEPKTKKSKRKISLPDGLVDHLREHYLNARKKRLTMGDSWKGVDHFFVFSNDEGKAYYPETPYLWFRNFLRKNNLRYIRFHDLRHTSATILINQGVHAKVISERLGHANISTTMNVYGHVLQSADKDAANKFNSIIPIKQKRTK